MEKLTIKGISGVQRPSIQYFSTWRDNGHSTGAYQGLNLGAHCGDVPSVVEANREQLGKRLPSVPVWLNQVHGTSVFDADNWDGVEVPTADASVTSLPNRVLSVLTADCLPVVLSDEEGTVVAVAHAGWRGLAQGVLQATIQAMLKKQPRLGRLNVWIGPAISQKHFEVGEEVRAEFVGQDTNAACFFVQAETNSKYYADLAGLARYVLYRYCGGVVDVALSGECTYEQSDRYYSYRRATTTGRLATLAWLQSA